MFLTIALIKGWHTRQVDFVLAPPQADIETELFMEIPHGFEFENSRKTHCLPLIKNFYGQKQAGHVWNKHLHKGLVKMGFIQSKINECIYYRASTISLCYVDDSILIDPDPNVINRVIEEFPEHKYTVTDEGKIGDYLGVKIKQRTDGTIKLTQPHMINQILEDLNLLPGQNGGRYAAKTCDTPAQSMTTLQQDIDGDAQDKKGVIAPWLESLIFLRSHLVQILPMQYTTVQGSLLIPR
jgi:hypothetical protein